MKAGDIIGLCRFEHWVKNILVLLPPFFVCAIFNAGMPLRAAACFISFSLVASAVYAVNDIFDRERDSRHPVKCRRPIASGAVGVNAAVVLVAILAAVGFGLVCAAHAPAGALVTLALYFAANAAYSAKLKNAPIFDIFILASGFVFRIFFGGFFFGVPISSWLFLCVFSGALFFACGKRKSELARIGADSRPVLKFYTAKFLDAHYYMFCGLSILFYCLWTISRTDTHNLERALAVPVLIFILVRYNLRVESGECDGDPVPLFLHDKWLVAATLLFALINFFALYHGSAAPCLEY